MRARPNREINVFSMSAIDLFASAMGVFLIIAILLSDAQSETKVEVDAIDVVYVVDTTISMGKGIDQLRGSLIGTVMVLERMAESVRIGVVAYKAVDPDNEYELIKLDLVDTQNGGMERIQEWVGKLSAQGGGDEIVFRAMQAAVDMPWRAGAKNLIVVVADEPDNAANRPPLDQLVRSFGAADPGRKVSGYLAPEDFSKLRGSPPSLFEELRQARAVVRGWMEGWADDTGGIFMDSAEGDLTVTTLMSAVEDVD